MDASSMDLHFVLIPLMAQGHTLPMVDIARLLAHRGATVTIITTPLNANRFKPVIARETQANLKIQIVEVEFQLAEVGLPQAWESFDNLPSADQRIKLFLAMDMLEKPTEEVLRELLPAPSCIISDSAFPWTTGMAGKLNIPRIVFYGPGCFWTLCIHVVFITNILQGIKSDSERFVLPQLPDQVEVTKPQILGRTEKVEINGLKEFRQQIREADKDAYGIVVNSFQELEPEYAQQVAKVKDKKVWCIGPVSLCNKSNLDMAERGNKAAISEHDCFKWLESREPGSVLYVCLGSLTRASKEQAVELGLGLESTQRPFIWCIRNKIEELERWFSEEQFEARIKDRGLIVHGWAPQVLIMSHQAVGGFLTHCGWNSTLEAISAGMPMVTWPHFADQFINEKFIVQVLKIGVRVGVEVPIDLGEQDKIGVLVKKEDIKTAVECLMDEREEGKERRKRVKELGKMAMRAMEEGGSSHLNMTSLIQDVSEYLTKNV